MGNIEGTVLQNYSHSHARVQFQCIVISYEYDK